MRTLRLVRIAAEAEGVRLREQARRTVVRAMLGIIALGFLVAAIVLGHVPVWYWLRLYWAEPGTALAIRRRAWDGVAGSAALWRLALQLLHRLVDLMARKYV